MKTYKKVLIWFGSILIALMVTGYLAMDYAIDYVLDSMTNQAIEEALKTNLDDGKQDVKGDSNGNAIAGDQEGHDRLIDSGEGSGNLVPDGQASSPPPSDSTSVGGDSQDDSVHSNPSSESGAKAQDASKPTKESSGTKADQLTYSAEIPTDKAEIVKEGITVKEKAAVASVILTKFSASELKLFADLASGGLTIEEKKSAKIKFLDTLSEEEYDRLIVIAAKYGLSEGDKYSETGRP